MAEPEMMEIDNCNAKHIEAFQEKHNVSVLKAHHYDEPELMNQLFQDVIRLEKQLDGVVQPTVDNAERIDPSTFITAKSIINDFEKYGTIPEDHRLTNPPTAPLAPSTTGPSTGPSTGLGLVPEGGHGLTMQIMSIKPCYNRKCNSAIMLHGRTNDNKSACVIVNGFYTRCYIRYKNTGLINEAMKWIRHKVESTFKFIYQNNMKDCSRYGCKCKLQNRSRNARFSTYTNCSLAARNNIKRIIRSVKVVHKNSAMGYEKSTSPFIEITFNYDFTMKRFMDWFNKRKYDPEMHKNESEREFFTKGQLFEANVSFTNRFMNDKNIKGSSIININTLDVYPITQNYGVQSRCDYAFSVTSDRIKPVDNTADIYPVKVLSYDIETTCNESGDEFSNSDNDSVIQISAHYSSCSNGVWTDIDGIVYTIGSTGSIEGGDTLDLYNLKGRTRSFDREEQMILAFWQDLISMSPDVMTGYNDGAFDMPYLRRRSEILGLDFFPYFGKARNIKSVDYMYVKSSNQTGSLDIHTSHTPGIIHWDLFTYLRQFVNNLPGYSLNAVSTLWLSGAKEDIRYADIPKYQKTMEGRTKLASYCLLDSVLVTNIIMKRCFLLEMVASSRMLLTSVDDLLLMGLNNKITNYLRWVMNNENIVIPTLKMDMPTFQKQSPSWNPDWDYEKVPRVPLLERYNVPTVWDYKGAFVLDPDVRLHKDHLTLVLDFKSLYPAEQRYFNISSDTYIVNEQHLRDNGLTLEDVYEIKINDDDGNHVRTHYFIKEHIKCGVMTTIQDNLATQRNNIKKQMKQYVSSDPMFSVYNVQQLSVKLVMNSIYGLAASKFSSIPVRAIAESITACGRQHLIQSRDWILERYPGRCIYGDTDSVFMQIDEVKTVEDSFRIGAAIEKTINDSELGGIFDKKKAMYLEYEKVYKNLLLLGKKQYVGMKYEWDHKLNQAVAKLSSSGVKTVRRDNAKLIKDVSNDIFKSVVEHGKPEIVVGLIRERLQKLLSNKLPLEDLVTSAKLSNWTPKVKQAHVAVARKMRNRGRDVALGDRVYYYVTQGPKKLGVSDLAESLEYGKEHEIPANFMYYIKAIIKAVKHIGMVVYADNDEGLEEFMNALDVETYSRVIVGNGPMCKFVTQKLVYGPKPVSVVGKKRKQSSLDSFFTQ